MRAPPPPVVIILLPLKLKVPISPKRPQCVVFKELPRASVESSTTGKPNSEATSTICEIRQGLPKI